MQQLKSACVAVSLSVLTACASTLTPPGVKVQPPANTMGRCDPPIASIKNLADAFNAAVINAQRLNTCSILHDGLIQFENAR